MGGLSFVQRVDDIEARLLSKQQASTYLEKSRITSLAIQLNALSTKLFLRSLRAERPWELPAGC